MRWWKQRLSSILLAGFAMVTLTAVDLSVREDELECEQAVAHLVSCCPGFDPSSVICEYQACSVHPDLLLAESLCIVALDCGDVRARGLCTSVPALDQTRHDNPDAPPVCE